MTASFLSWKRCLTRDFLSINLSLLLCRLFTSFSVYSTAEKRLPTVHLLVRAEPVKGPSRHKMASDSPTQCLLIDTHTQTHTVSVTRSAQWEVPAKRAAIVHMRALGFSPEIYSSLKQPAPFPLNHNTMDMLIWSSTWDKSSKMGLLLYLLIWLWSLCFTQRWWQLYPLASDQCTNFGTASS